MGDVHSLRIIHFFIRWGSSRTIKQWHKN